MVLTTKSIKEISKIFKFFYFFGVSPFLWHDETQSLRITSSRCRIAVWKASVGAQVCYAVYVTLSLLYRFIQSDFNDTQDLVMHTVWMTTHVTLVIGVISNVL